MDFKTAQTKLGVSADGVLGRMTWAALFQFEGARPPDALWLGQAMAEHGQAIASPLEVCHFLAQAGHETGGFRYFRELGGPAYCTRYDGRVDLGNTEPGDGFRFRGAGIFELTGRANFLRMGRTLGVDLVADPERAARPDISARIAVEFWREHSLGRLAAADDVVAITERINGGRNGLEDRTARLAKLKALFQ